MNSKDHKKRVADQFSRTAVRYASSKQHSGGYSLETLVKLAALKSSETALDIATGSGHAALALATRCQLVVAIDLSFEMLRLAASIASQRSIYNLVQVQCDAEALCFRSASFNVVTSRIAAHHFPDIGKLMAEVFDLLSPGGRFVLVDTWVPTQPLVASFINEIEQLRDPTHHRSLSSPEWRALIEATGMSIRYHEAGCVEGQRSFREWVSLADTPADRVSRIRGLLLNANPEIQRALAVAVEEDDISFQIPRVIILAVKGRL